MNLPAWLTGRLGGSKAEQAQAMQKSSAFLQRILQFGRTVKPSWTADGRRLKKYRVARYKAVRVVRASRRRNRYSGHPLGKVKT